MEPLTVRRRAGLAYNPAFDALRALSVLAVVAYHAGALSGGWIGVEVFFVLSGYLITSLLIAEHDRTGTIDLLGFWRRRARRLLPGLLLLTVMIGFYAWWFEPTRPSTTIARDAVGLLTYSSNWSAIGGGGYWSRFEVPSPLRHAWSLAIEEQVYVLYPVVCLVALRPAWRRIAIPALTLAALAWQVVASTRFDVDRVYLGTDTRAFGLLAGATVAILLGERSIRSARAATAAGAAGLIGLTGLAAGAIALGDATPTLFRGPFQGLVLATAALLVATADPRAWLGRLLGRRPLVLVGRWSYGIYLFHWPILLAIEPDPARDPWLLAAVVLAVTIPLAAVSYALVEAPIRARGFVVLGGGHRLPIAGVVTAAVALATAATAVQAPPTADEVLAREIDVNAPTTGPRVGSMPPVPPSTGTAPSPPATPASTTTTVGRAVITNGRTIRPGAPSTTSSSTTTSTTSTTTTTSSTTTSTSSPTTTLPPVVGRAPRPESRPFRIYLVGDSLGVSIERNLLPLTADLDVEVFSRSADSCSYDRAQVQYFDGTFQPEACAAIVAGWRDDVLAYQPDAVLFAYAAWWGWLHDGAVRTQCDPPLADHVRSLYDLALADLGASGAPVYFLAPATWEGRPTGPDGIPTYFDCLRDVMRSWVAAHAGAAGLVDVAAALCTGGRCDATVMGAPVRPDGVHFDGLAAPAAMVMILDAMTSPPPGGWPAYGTIVRPG